MIVYYSKYRSTPLSVVLTIIIITIDRSLIIIRSYSTIKYAISHILTSFELPTIIIPSYKYTSLSDISFFLNSNVLCTIDIVVVCYKNYHYNNHDFWSVNSELTLFKQFKYESYCNTSCRKMVVSYIQFFI